MGHTMRISLFFLCILACLGQAVPASATVSVSDVQRFPVVNGAATIKSGEFISHKESMKSGERLEITATINNMMFKELAVFVCREDKVQAYLNGDEARCFGLKDASGKINFLFQAQQSGRYVLLFDNRNAVFSDKEVSLTVIKNAIFSLQEKDAAIRLLGGLSREMAVIFELPELHFSVKPCGFENASSNNLTGNIIVCSELFNRLTQQGRQGALLGIVLHELGHSSLNLWQMPNWNNEETVDEFAVYMLYKMGRQELAHDMAAYFAERNSESEAQRVLQVYSEHPISIQRARKINRILRDPHDTIHRWNQLVYPKMTKAGLQDVADNPGPYGDRRLAVRLMATKFPIGSR